MPLCPLEGTRAAGEGPMLGETGVDLAIEQPKVIKNAVRAAFFCSGVLAASYLVLPRYVSFPDDLLGALALTLRADLFVFLWVVIGVRMVSRVRFVSAADNRGSAFSRPSPQIAVPLAFLQNTLEQTVIAVGAHLALATLLTGPLLALIPAAVLLFAVGRVTFLMGYPQGAGARAFGMVTTVLPTLAGYGLAIVLMIGRLL